MAEATTYKQQNIKQQHINTNLNANFNSGLYIRNDKTYLLAERSAVFMLIHNNLSVSHLAL